MSLKKLLKILNDVIVSDGTALHSGHACYQYSVAYWVFVINMLSELY